MTWLVAFLLSIVYLQRAAGALAIKAVAGGCFFAARQWYNPHRLDLVGVVRGCWVLNLQGVIMKKIALMFALSLAASSSFGVSLGDVPDNQAPASNDNKVAAAVPAAGATTAAAAATPAAAASGAISGLAIGAAAVVGVVTVAVAGERTGTTGTR